VEIRARYLQIGVFTLIVMVAGFAFVYWLNNAGALRDRVVYRLRFEGSVSGLQRGSAVLFNGVRVGEVTSLKLDPGSPRRVEAVIAVNRDTPVGADTTVSIDFQGLTGSPVVALAGGTSKERLVSDGEPPLLSADAAGQQSMTQAARDVLARLDGILADNAKPLHSMIGNLETFLWCAGPQFRPPGRDRGGSRTHDGGRHRQGSAADHRAARARTIRSALVAAACNPRSERACCTG